MRQPPRSYPLIFRGSLPPPSPRSPPPGILQGGILRSGGGLGRARRAHLPPADPPSLPRRASAFDIGFEWRYVTSHI